MELRDDIYNSFVNILKEELVPAMGCTEPIALAYAAAKARDILGAKPDKIVIGASGSIIKNVKSVIVPNTDHLKGIPAAVVAGVVAGKAEKELEVISEVTKSEIEEMKSYIETTDITVNYIDNGLTFDIDITVYAGEESANVRIAVYHTNIVHMEKNGEVIFDEPVEGEKEEGLTDRSSLSIKNIYEFVEILDTKDVEEVLQRQIDYNTAIAEEGLKGEYGACVGKTMLEAYGDNVRVKASAMAAAASDARMSGCELPVIINSGSGNQGITCSLPVLEFAKELKSDKEKIYKSLALSNLIAIHLKTGIGRLSAYCGAVTAGAAAGAGIAYINGGDYAMVAHTIVNALASVSGMVCDGAKASCASKIAASVEASILGYEMYKRGHQFRGGDGIIEKCVENTIGNVGRLGKDGMKKTNEEIINIMVGC